MPHAPDSTSRTLADRVTVHRDRLEQLMTGAGRRDDICSAGGGGGYGGGGGGGYGGYGGYDDSQQYRYTSYPSDPSDQVSTASTDRPEIFDQRDYQGASMRLDAGEYELANPSAVDNDTISSVKVPSGWKVTLYEDAKFQGKSKTFTSDTPYVGDDFNDIASSIKVERI